MQKKEFSYAKNQSSGTRWDRIYCTCKPYYCSAKTLLWFISYNSRRKPFGFSDTIVLRSPFTFYILPFPITFAFEFSVFRHVRIIKPWIKRTHHVGSERNVYSSPSLHIRNISLCHSYSPCSVWYSATFMRFFNLESVLILSHRNFIYWTYSYVHYSRSLWSEPVTWHDIKILIL